MPLPSGFAGLDPPADWPRSRSGPRPESLERPVDALKGVGPAVSKRLAKLDLRRVGDLLLYRPRRYESAVPEVRIADLFGAEEVAIAGEILSVSERRRGRLKILTARVADDSGTISATWFNQPWLTKQLEPGTHIRLRGKPDTHHMACETNRARGACCGTRLGGARPSRHHRLLCRQPARSTGETGGHRHGTGPGDRGGPDIARAQHRLNAHVPFNATRCYVGVNR